MVKRTQAIRWRGLALTGLIRYTTPQYVHDRTPCFPMEALWRKMKTWKRDGLMLNWNSQTMVKTNLTIIIVCLLSYITITLQIHNGSQSEFIMNHNGSQMGLELIFGWSTIIHSRKTYYWQHYIKLSKRGKYCSYCLSQIYIF